MRARLANGLGWLHSGRMFADGSLHRINRAAFINEWVPEHYFQRARADEIGTDDQLLEIDLGCGDGTFLIGMAEQFPDRTFLGVERLLGRVEKVCKKISRNRLSNARVLRLESRYAVEWLLPLKSISRMHLLCPDPWPKARHSGRRIIQQPFLQAVHAALIPQGEFLFMTDHDGNYEWTLEHVAQFGKFTQLPWDEETFFYPKTDFQMQWESQGKSMRRLRMRCEG